MIIDDYRLSVPGPQSIRDRRAFEAEGIYR
jgi:hypothetical protein